MGNNNTLKSDKNVSGPNVRLANEISLTPIRRRHHQNIERLKDAAITVLLNQNSSVSFLKKVLGLNNKQAEKLMERLEYAGIIGPKCDTDTESREVLVSSFDELEQKFLEMTRCYSLDSKE